jgi:hypothetical protein
MNALGTITMYYPFLDPETHTIIEAIMDATQTYREFVLILGERACENDMPVNLAYMAALHAWHLSEVEVMLLG